MTVVRIYGRDLDADALLRALPLVASAIHRKGEPVSPLRPGGAVCESSDVVLGVSSGKFSDLDQQVVDAERYLVAHREALLAARVFPGVEGLTIDFGVEWKDTVTQTDSFPASLIALMGELRLALDVSHYPISSDP